MRLAMWPVRLAVALLLAAAGTALAASSASAHAVLRSTTPRNGAVLQAMPAAVVATFDDTVAAPAYMTVTGPAGRVDSGQARVAGDQVSVAVRASAPAGRYTVAYRVVSDDGHPVEGTFTFQLQGASAAAPAASGADSGTPAASGAAGSHAAHWLAGTAGVAMVVCGGGALVWERRQRRRGLHAPLGPGSGHGNGGGLEPSR